MSWAARSAARVISSAGCVQALVVRRPALEHVGEAEDHREQVVEVVGDAAREPSHRLHLLRLKELPLLLLQRAPLLTTALRLAELAFHHRSQPEQAVLNQEIAGPRLHEGGRLLLADEARHHHEGDVLARGAHDLQRVPPIEARHREVGEHDVPLPGLQGRAQAVRGVDPLVNDFVTGALQLPDEQGDVLLLVLDDQGADQAAHGAPRARPNRSRRVGRRPSPTRPGRARKLPSGNGVSFTSSQ